MVNLYKLYFQPNKKKKKKIIPPFFHPSNQTQMRETKIFSIFSLFHPLSIFYLLIFSSSQPNGKSKEIMPRVL